MPLSGEGALNPATIRIARRIAVQMCAVAEQQIDMNFFQGMGICLAFCFEEMTGRSARYQKPKDLLQWALNLPEEKYPRVTLG